MIPAARSSRSILRAAAALLTAAISASGCREIPPRIPPDYIGSPAAPGWPPLAVHDPDPFDPRNRWFHRAFGSRSPAGDIIAPRADEPCSFAAPSRVDAAELFALLERMLASPRPGGAAAGRERIADAILRSDALAEASRLHAVLPGDDLAVREAVPLLLRLAAGEPLASLDPETARALEPPPLRAGGWVEAAPPAEPGLLPSPLDPRWTRAVMSPGPDGGPSRAAILRCRTALDREGAPVLLPIASECWELNGGRGGEAAVAVWRFDRAEWLAGREPWRRLPDRAEITVRDPADPARLLAGPAASLAARCRPRGLRAALPGARGKDAQLEAVAGALRGVLWPRSGGPWHQHELQTPAAR